MKSQSSDLRVTEDLAQALKRSLTPFLSGDQLEATHKKWVGLLKRKQYNHDLALRTLSLKKGYVERLSYRTPLEILQDSERHFSLGSALHYRGEAITLTYLILMLNTVFKLIKAGKTIEDHALRELAVMIIEDFEWLTFPDVKLCLRNGIKGKYGEVFDRVDVQVIYRWFEAYKSERLAASEKLRRELKRALDIDIEENAVPMPEDIKKKFEILENKMRTNEEKAAKFEPSISKKINHLRT